MRFFIFNKGEYSKGFTLVELAIVLTIIGLLIGGILKGQQMIQNSRITTTLAQVKAIEAAVTAFRDTYRGMPGDMTMADRKVPGCTAICGNTGIEAGDGIVGYNDWNLVEVQMTDALAAANNAAEGETVLFWVELAMAGFISGVTNEGIAGGSNALTFGGAYPAARVGGGFLVGYSDGNQDGKQASTRSSNGKSKKLSVVSVYDAGRPNAAGNFSFEGTILALAASVVNDIGKTAGAQVVSSTAAAQMDRKMDDGKPDTGNIQAYGTTVSCYGGTTAPFSYKESVSSKDCGLYFKVQ